MAAMLEFRTQGFNPYAVKYSPYHDSRIAVGTAANFGIVGNGRLFALALTAQGIQVEKTFDTNDAIYDLAWSEINENQLVVACGDGSLKLFDIGMKEFPIMIFHEHNREAFAAAWNPVTKDTFISSSWDGTVKIVLVAHSPLLHQDSTHRQLYLQRCILSLQPFPNLSGLFRLPPPNIRPANALLRQIPPRRDRSRPRTPSHPGAMPAGGPPAEVLTHDWNKYRDTVIATGGVDRLIRTFDIRNPTGGPLSVMHGHEYAVRRLSWSPHASDVLISASYDMTVRLWNDASNQPQAPVPTAQPGAQMGVMNRHTEFVTGVDWCLFGAGGWVASAGWDERVLLWDANLLMRPR
ncbi:hypothetical protein TrVFT333_001616 [Trichoderma virens FT-333]|nr:hypothetical protein TrVFT333_001616 [Trichoderma virens FT-333]